MVLNQPWQRSGFPGLGHFADPRGSGRENALLVSIESNTIIDQTRDSTTGDRPPMTPENKALVKRSWAKITPMADQATAMLYDHLFTQHPEVRPLFKGEIEEQGPKLVRMIDKAVSALDDMEPLDRVIRMMGARHSGYGVDDEDYAKFGEALIWTLEQGLGNDFTPETRAAWVTVYDELAEMMKDGAATA
jgi:hemoglobin-like flavoprotein